MLGEFKEFAVKRSVVDMAVGIVIGGAFGGKRAGALVMDYGQFLNAVIHFKAINRRKQQAVQPPPAPAAALPPEGAAA